MTTNEIITQLFYWLGVVICLSVAIGAAFLSVHWCGNKYRNFVYAWANWKMVDEAIRQWKEANPGEHQRRLRIADRLTLRKHIENIRKYIGVQE